MATVRRAWGLFVPDRPGGRLDDVDVRIAVLGGYQRPVVTHWLYEAFDERGYDTCGRIAGPEPKYLVDGFEFPASANQMGSATAALNGIRRYEPEVAIVENAGSLDYGLWLLNDRYRPHMIVLPAVGRGYAEALGRDRRAVVRQLARSVPPGTHVVSGERNDALYGYLSAELAQRNATCTRELGTGETSPWSDGVALVNGTLEHVDGRGLSPERRDRYLAERRSDWTDLPDGRVFDATEIPDTESIELLRRSLDGDDPVVPVVCASSERYDLIADYVEYLNWLAGWGDIECAHIVGGPMKTVARRAAVPVRAHDPDKVTPGEVLDAAGRDGSRRLLMATAPSSFVSGLREIVEARKEDPPGETVAGVSRASVGRTAGRLPTTTREILDSGTVPEDAVSILLLGADRNALWQSPADEDTSVLTISYFPPPEGALDVGLGVQHVITVGHGTGNGVETVDDPGDVDAIADLIDAHLANQDGTAVIRLDSATALLQAAGPTTGIAFLRAVLEHVEQQGATMYVQFNPEAHTQSLLALLRELFDHTVEVDHQHNQAVT